MTSAEYMQSHQTFVRAWSVNNDVKWGVKNTEK